MRAIISALIVCAMLNGCATAYTGPQPDFSQTGPDAIVEYKKFELGNSYGAVNTHSVEMNNQPYFTETVEPIINQVSPTSTATLKTMRIAHYVSLGFLVATLATIFAPQDSWAHQTGYWIGLGGILASGIYVNVSGMRAAREFNNDLKSKFTPALALSKTF